MLIVMLVLLMVTATAAYAAHATATEIRGAGQQRIGMETHYVAQAALVASMDLVDRMGPQMLVRLTDAERRAAQAGTPNFQLAPFEPPFASAYNPSNTTGSSSVGAVSQYGTRLYLEQLRVTSGSGSTQTVVAPVGSESFGVRQTHSPMIVVDVYDMYLFQGSIAGQRQDGFGQLYNLRATYTARARARTGNPNVTPTGAAAFQEVASDARCEGVSGPFGL